MLTRGGQKSSAKNWDFGLRLTLRKRSRASSRLYRGGFGGSPNTTRSPGQIRPLADEPAAPQSGLRLTQPPLHHQCFLYPKKPRWRISSATCGGTVSSQVSSPLAIRLSTSREKIERYSGL